MYYQENEKVGINWKVQGNLSQAHVELGQSHPINFKLCKKKDKMPIDLDGVEKFPPFSGE